MNYSKRQLEIIEASLDIIKENGIENLTTKKIAEKIGISEAGLYRHFKSKLEITLEILNYFKEKAIETLNSIPENYSKVEQIKYILEKKAKEFSEKPGLVVLILLEEIIPPQPVLTEKIREIISLNKTKLKEIIVEGQRNGEIRTDIDPEILFQIIIGSFRFIVTRWRIENFKYDIVYEFKKLWDGIEKFLRR